MTTKDQAIAPKVMLFNPYTGRPRHPSDIQSDPQGVLIADPAETFLRAYKPPAPDCRTCKQYQEDEGVCIYPLYHGMKQCTNGDQYQPAPALVLWRMES